MVLTLHLRVPATSANLGPGFDALGLAMSLYLTIEAEASSAMRLSCSGRDCELTSRVDGNVILETYARVLAGEGREASPLSLTLHNEIPLGMGCGSSAAALLAGVHLANHFGGLGWTARRILTEACLLEGHPDNVAACALGGMTASCQRGTEIVAASVGRDLDCRLLLAIPGGSLSTAKARALLPEGYSRGDAVANVQGASLLVAAFALGRSDLLRVAMQDRMHQPFRVEACPLLPRLLPLAASVEGVYGVALSGAGPAVLLIVDPATDLCSIERVIRDAAEDDALEVLTATIAGPAVVRAG